MGERRLGDPEHRIHVRLEHRVELLGRDVLQVIDRMLLRGVVHQDVEPAHRLRRIGDELGAERLVADVAGQRGRLAARILDQAHDLARIRLLDGKVVEGDVRALPREGDRGGTADAGVAAGDQRLPADQLAAAAVARLAMVGLRVHRAREAWRVLLLRGEGRTRIGRAGVTDVRPVVHRCGGGRHGLRGGGAGECGKQACGQAAHQGWSGRIVVFGGHGGSEVAGRAIARAPWSTRTSNGRLPQHRGGVLTPGLPPLGLEAVRRRTRGQRVQ